MHIHCTVLVLQLKQIRTEILLQSSPKNSQQFNGRKYTAKVGQVGQFNGIEPPVTLLSFVWLFYLGILGFKLNRILKAGFLRASSYEPGNWAGSVAGTNSVVCSYGKFQPGRPG